MRTGQPIRRHMKGFPFERRIGHDRVSACGGDCQRLPACGVPRTGHSFPRGLNVSLVASALVAQPLRPVLCVAGPPVGGTLHALCATTPTR